MRLMVNGVEVDPDDLQFTEVQKKRVTVGAIRMYSSFRVDTIDGQMRGEPGDYLMRGVRGELYPCKGDIFQETYEEASVDRKGS